MGINGKRGKKRIGMRVEGVKKVWMGINGKRVENGIGMRVGGDEAGMRENGWKIMGKGVKMA